MGAALKEGMHGVNDAIALVQDDPDYSTLPCYDEVVAFMDCADKNSVSAECMACDKSEEEWGEEAEYETCEPFQADWGPNGAKCTARQLRKGQSVSKVVPQVPVEEILRLLKCVVAAIKEECPGGLCGWD